MKNEKKFIDKQKIYQTLKNRILLLEYTPGMILNEKELTSEFNVSRTPLREVLTWLEKDSMVRILPRTGTLVTELHFEKMIHAYQIRLETEKLVWRFAAENIDDDNIKAIASLEEECRLLLTRMDLKAIATIDFRLRDILYSVANNPLLKDISEYLYNITIRAWYLIYDRGDWREETAAYLEDIILTKEVLLKKDPISAGETRHICLSKHIERIRSKFTSWQ